MQGSPKKGLTTGPSIQEVPNKRQLLSSRLFNQKAEPIELHFPQLSRSGGFPLGMQLQMRARPGCWTLHRVLGTWPSWSWSCCPPVRPASSTAEEVRSQPLTAAWKPILGPSQSSPFVLSRQQWGPCKFWRLRQHLAEEFFPVSLQCPAKAFLGAGGPSWAWSGAASRGKQSLPWSRGKSRCPYMCQALSPTRNHFMAPGGGNVQTEADSTLFFSSLSFLDYCLSSHPQYNLRQVL